MVAVVLAGTLSGAAVLADVLVLRNGQRVDGRLVSVRNGVIEFEEDRGGRVVRVDVDEVRSIEFDRGAGLFDRGGDRERDRQSDLPNDIGRPRGLRERDVRVFANTAWTDTGVTLRAGQTVYFTARGRVRWGPGRQDGPEGESNSPRNNNRPIPSRPGAALIGRVGDDAPFFIGANESTAVRIRNGGTLFLGVNDDVLDDNSGNFDVTVYF